LRKRSSDEELFLGLYFAELREGAWPYLDAAAQAAFDRLFDPRSASYLLCRPDFHLTHLETLAIGQRPGAIQDARGSVIFADPSLGKDP